MWGRKRRRIAELEARLAYLHEAGGHQAVEDAEEQLAVTARQFANLSARFIERTTEACQLRTELSAAERRAGTLQRRLDEALGMDHPGITAGADWQARREDIRPVPKPAPPAGARRPLPARRPGPRGAAS